MTADERSTVSVRSDLHLEVDDLRASLVADGRHLTLVTNDTGRLLAQARATSLPAGSTPSLRQVAARLLRGIDDAGLSARVVGDRGVLLETGEHCDSRVAGLLLGAEHVRLGSVGAVVPALGSYVAASAYLRRRMAYAVGGVAMAAVLAGVGRRSRTVPRRRAS